YLSFADFFLQTFTGVGMILVLLDEEERRRREALAAQAERLLQEERDFSAQVVETADAFIVVLEPSGRMVRRNGKCGASVGGSEGGRTRALWERTTAPAVAAALREAFARALAKGGAEVEAPLRDRAGAERVVAWHLSVLRGEAGQVRWVIGAGLDVT